CLKPEILSPACFIDDLLHGQLKNSRHTGDRLALVQFFAHEERQNKIVNGQMRLTNEVPKGRGTPQPSGPMNQSSHEPQTTPWKLSGKQTRMSPGCFRSLFISMFDQICERTLQRTNQQVEKATCRIFAAYTSHMLDGAERWVSAS